MGRPAWRKAPLIYVGGPIHTMAGSPTEAVVVDGSRIVFAGSEGEARQLAGDDAMVRDLDGACLMPGFVDAHTHPLMLGQSTFWADSTGIASVPELIETLRRHAEQLPPGAPIRGFGYEQALLGRQPTADDLDRVSSDQPVVLMHRSGHGYVVNHAALAEAGISRDTPSPEGGLIGRDGEGRLDGRIFDSACDLLTDSDGVKITNHGPNFHLSDHPETLVDQLALAQQRLLAAGITSVADCQVTPRELRSFQTLRKRNHLTLRVTMMVLSSHLNALENLGLGNIGDDFLHLGGVKLYVDGSVSSGTAYVPTDCSDDTEHLYHSPDEYTDLVTRAHGLGLQTATHAQGPEAIRMVLDAVERAQQVWPGRDLRHRIEHCAFPADDDLPRMKELGVWPVPQPTQVIQFVEGAMETYGTMGERMYPYGSFQRAGIPIVLSSDTPVTEPDPMLAMWAAATRQVASGDVVGGSERIDPTSALAGYTINGARAIHREHAVGSIEVGKLADFVILERAPLETPIEEWPTIDTVETIVGGVSAWKRE